MKKALLLLLSAAPLLAGAAPPPAQPNLQAELDSLVAAERAFSKTSEEKGIKPAFLAFLADDGVLFRPGPVPGKAWTEKAPNPPILLTWRPVKADIARSGDLGYTTGPWEIRETATSEAVAFGNYITVWQKQADGTWKVKTDIGNSNPKPTAAPAEALRLDPAEVESRGGVKDAAKDPQAAEAALLAADRAFAKAAQAQGDLAAYQSVLAADSRLFRVGPHPLIGKDAIHGFLANQKGVLTWEPEHAGVSRAVDLGYTYGSYDQTAGGPEGKPEKGYYLRIWKKPGGDAWKLVVDVASPLPPPPPPPAPASPPAAPPH